MTTVSENDSAALHPAPGWSAHEGHSAAASVTVDAASSNAIDRILIAERIARYGWSYDERDTQRLGECFTIDGVWEGRIMGEVSVGPFQGRSAIVTFLLSFWPQQSDQRRHIFSNVVVDDLTGTSATAHAYLHLTKSEAGILSSVTVGPYRFEAVKEEGVWRFARLKAGFDVPF